MANKKILLAYHSANTQAAKEIDQNLNRADYTFEHIVCDQGDKRLHQRISDLYDPIILLISDNFLRCEDCMYELLPVFQDLTRASRVKAIITDGVYEDEQTGIITTKATSFERVSNVIQYMNYWQDQYLEVRRQKRQLSSEEEIVLNEQLRIIRSISSEIGEFLRFLRNKDYTTYPEFKANRFYAFFNFTNDLSAHSNFVELAPPSAPSETPQTVQEIVEIEEDVKLEETPENISTPIIEEEIVVEEVETEATSFVEDMDKAYHEMERGEVSDLTSFFEEDTLAVSEEEVMEEEIEMEAEPIAEELEIEEVIESVEIPEEIPQIENIEENIEENVAEGLAAVAISDEIIEETATQKEEENVESIIISGNELIEEGQVYTALRRFEEGLAIYPESPALRYTFAKAILKYREDFGNTRKQLEKLLEYDPKNTDAYFLLGELDEIQEHYTAAKLNFEQVISIDSSYPNANYRLANLIANKFEGAEETAAKYFAIAIAQNPKNTDAHYQYAVLQEEYLDNKEAAIEHFQQTLALAPNHPYAHYDLAVLYHELGQTEAAKTAYEKAALINPEVKTAQNDAAFLVINTAENENIPYSTAAEIEGSKELINKLQDDIKRLENLMLKNQNLLQNAQSDITNLPFSQEEENRAIITEKMEVAASPKVIKNPKTVLITGATSGIGKASADIFAENGYRLILTGRRMKRLEDLKAFYEENYQSEVLITAFDVRDQMAVEEVVANLSEEWRSIDILVNNAGLAKGFEPIHEGKLQDWETMIDTNIKGLLYMTRAVAPLMVAREEGHIINICSIAGKEVYPNGGVYCATKHAVDALTKGMRIDLHKYGIRVSQVSPAHVEETEFALVRYDGDKERAKIYEDFQPLRASDVADTIYYMATRPKHVNIQDMVILGSQQASATIIDRSGRGESEDMMEEQAEGILELTI